MGIYGIGIIDFVLDSLSSHFFPFSDRLRLQLRASDKPQLKILVWDVLRLVNDLAFRASPVLDVARRCTEVGEPRRTPPDPSSEEMQNKTHAVEGVSKDAVEGQQLNKLDDQHWQGGEKEHHGDANEKTAQSQRPRPAVLVGVHEQWRRARPVGENADNTERQVGLSEHQVCVLEADKNNVVDQRDDDEDEMVQETRQRH